MKANMILKRDKKRHISNDLKKDVLFDCLQELAFAQIQPKKDAKMNLKKIVFYKVGGATFFFSNVNARMRAVGDEIEFHTTAPSLLQAT